MTVQGLLIMPNRKIAKRRNEQVLVDSCRGGIDCSYLYIGVVKQLCHTVGLKGVINNCMEKLKYVSLHSLDSVFQGNRDTGLKYLNDRCAKDLCVDVLCML